jgi:hypothetical protein
MRIEENAGGGDTVFVERGDKLTDVPKSHRHLITPEIAKAFRDPIQYFSTLADRSPFENFSKWLRVMLSTGQWELEINDGYWSEIGFRWKSPIIAEAMIGLPVEGATIPPLKALQEYYQLVDVVHWTVFGGAGGLEGAADHDTVASRFSHFQNPTVDFNQSHCWGSSGGGDQLIYSNDGRGGWVSHETGDVHWLGSIEDTINWVFGELLAGRSPDFDYRWITK